METIMESAADHYRHLGATSLCSGLAIECLISLEKYRVTKNQSALRPTISECQIFIKQTIAALKEEKAPYLVRRVYRELLDKNNTSRDGLLRGWQAVDDIISEIRQGHEPDEKRIDECIKFLKTIISQFNDISEHLEKKLYASSWFTRELW
ncbi:MAG: hypothetical protein QXQ94_08960 [Candidatus Bathyarchaeia archaeon]